MSRRIVFFGMLVLLLSASLIAVRLVFIDNSLKTGGGSSSGGSSVSQRIQHVIWVTMENREYSSIIGNTVMAPYQNQLAAKYTVAMQYYGVTHPSLPNYIAMTCGSDFGLTQDLVVSKVPHWILNQTNLVDLIRAKNLSWKVYAESMPYPDGMQVDSPDGLYVPRHNPIVYYHDVTDNYGAGTGPMSNYALQHIVPYTMAGFQSDLESGELANFTHVSPNIIDSAHTSTTLVGDRFLQKLIPIIENSKFWNSTVVFIVYDEGSTNLGFMMSNGVPVNGGKTVCIVVSPFAKAGYKNSLQYSHYSLLATTEKILGLANLGRNDTAANLMDDLFTVKLGS